MNKKKLANGFFGFGGILSCIGILFYIVEHLISGTESILILVFGIPGASLILLAIILDTLSREGGN